MQKFDYRSPRFPVDLPIQYTIEKLTWEGRCIEISIDGITLESRNPLPPGARGTVIIMYDDGMLDLNMRVIHAFGMEFIYRSDGERKTVSHLIESLSTSSNGLGPALHG